MVSILVKETKIRGAIERRNCKERFIKLFNWESVKNRQNRESNISAFSQDFCSLVRVRGKRGCFKTEA